MYCLGRNIQGVGCLSAPKVEEEVPGSLKPLLCETSGVSGEGDIHCSHANHTR